LRRGKRSVLWQSGCRVFISVHVGPALKLMLPRSHRANSHLRADD
jgi:hypothetical protein